VKDKRIGWALGTAIVGLILALAVGGFVASPVFTGAGVEEPVARSYGCAVYTEQGCAKLVVASGGEIQVESGATFDLQSGATTDFSSGVDLDGSTLTVDADADTTIVASYDDVITMTIGGASGRLDILTGNVRIGNGTPGETHNGEDLYVEGISEFDGQANFDGVLDADGAVNVTGETTFGVDGTAADVVFYSDTAGDFMRWDQSDEVLVITGTAAATALNVADGNVSVTDDLSVDGTTDLDGLLIMSSTSVTVTDGQTLTPVVNVYRINAASAVTITLASTCTDGQLLYLYGEDAQTISIADTNLLSHDGALDTFGQYDMMSLVCIASKWAQLGIVAANS
jgi:hypothetical protein